VSGGGTAKGHQNGQKQGPAPAEDCVPICVQSKAAAASSAPHESKQSGQKHQIVRNDAKRCEPRQTAVMGDIGLEPMTPSLSSDGTVVLSAANKALTASRADRCTNRCTEKPKQRDELARVVALVAQLPGTDDERAGLLKRAVELLASLDPRE